MNLIVAWCWYDRDRDQTGGNLTSSLKLNYEVKLFRGGEAE